MLYREGKCDLRLYAWLSSEIIGGVQCTVRVELYRNMKIYQHPVPRTLGPAVRIAGGGAAEKAPRPCARARAARGGAEPEGQGAALRLRPVPWVRPQIRLCVCGRAWSLLSAVWRRVSRVSRTVRERAEKTRRRRVG